MPKDSKIEWTDHTWSPWRGCTKVSEGCAHCYAETLSKRNPAVLGNWGKGAQRVKAKNWHEPMAWNRSRSPNAITKFQPVRLRVFPSLCDWLDDEVPIEWLAEFLTLIHKTPYLKWLLLTKRPEFFKDRLTKAGTWLYENDNQPTTLWTFDWVDSGEATDNVWIGTSVENQRTADLRIPQLLEIPAKVRFLSCEPLLGPVHINAISDSDGNTHDPLTGDYGIEGRGHTGPTEDRIHWIIIGGESGYGSRACNVDWVRSLLDQGEKSKTDIFVKQLGAVAVKPRDLILNDGEQLGELIQLSLKHPKGGEMSEWAADLQVRKVPHIW